MELVIWKIQHEGLFDSSGGYFGRTELLKFFAWLLISDKTSHLDGGETPMRRTLQQYTRALSFCQANLVGYAIMDSEVF
jgi:hypothetical protein